MPLDLEKIDLGGFGIGDDDTQPEVNTQVRANMDEALKINPDQHAQTTKLSQQSGVPEFAVQSDPAEVEHNLKLDNIDFKQMSTRNPNTAKYLTDFNNSVIAQDDIEVLQTIEDVLLAPGRFAAENAVAAAQGAARSLEGVGESILTGFSAQGKGFELAGVDVAPDRIQDLIPVGAMPMGIMSVSETQMMSTRFAESMGITTDEELQKVKKESIDKLLTELRELQEKRQQLTPEDLNLLQEGLRAGIESLGNMAPGTMLMLLSGGRAAPLLTTIGAQTFTGSYGEGRAEGLTPAEAGWFAGIDAAIEVGTEILPTKTIETIITGKSTGMTKSALKFMIQEMGTEQLATLGQSLNSYAFGLDKEMEQNESVEEMIQLQLRRQAITAIATVVAGGAQVTAATGLRKGIEALTQDENKKETQGDIEQQKIDRLNEQSEKSKLRERDKESFKQFVEQSDGENNTHVFIDGAQTSLYLQDKTREEIEADPALQLLADQAREASAQGNDIQIPVADFAADFAGTEHFEALRDSMTMSDETVSPFRQEQAKQETETYVRSLMDEAQENASEYVEAQEIYSAVRDQLIDTGQVTPANASIMAQIVPAWATAQARRQGKTVQQVYQDAGLVIEGPATGERARLEGEMVLEQEPAFKDAPEIFESARDKFLDVLPEDAEVSEVLEASDQFGPEYRNFINQLDQNDWLGFDFPSQAINAALSEELDQYEITPGLKQSIGRMVNAELAGKRPFEQPTIADVPQPATITEGIEVEEITDAEQQQKLLEEFAALRPGRVQAPEIPYRTVSGREVDDTWRTATRVLRGGKPAIVHRGASRKLTEKDFAKESLGGATGHPISGLGVYLSSDHGVASGYGPIVEQVHLDVRKPKIYTPDTTPAFDSLDDAHAHREELKKQGFDAVIFDYREIDGPVNFVVFDADQVIHPPAAEETQKFFQEKPVEPERDLFVAHNLSIDNLLHAEDIGGLATPSLAIASTKAGFEGFGEVSLLAEKELLQDPYAKTFGADIYSPRYPQVVYQIDNKEYNKIVDPLNEKLIDVGLPVIRADIESRGLPELYYDTGARYAYFDSIGKAPKIKYKKKESIPAHLKKFKGDKFNLMRDDEFIAAADKHYTEKAEKNARAIAEAGDQNEYDFWLADYRKTYFTEDGVIKDRFVQDLAYTVEQFHKPKQVDSYEIDRQLNKKLETIKAQAAFKEWINETFSDAVAAEKIFTGYTPSGNRKYIAHTLDNVVKIMNKKLRGGENFNYGIGTIRSATAPQFKTIKKIQESRGKIVSKTVMEDLKKETSDEFDNVVESLRSYYKYDSSGFGFLDAAAENLFDMARGKGLPDFENVPDDVRTQAAEFLSKLRDMPTEYFEAKIQRAVGIDEFDTAIVPKGTQKKVTDLLKSKGLKVKTYDPKVEGSRADVIAKQKQLLFQPTPEKRQPRGYYDPANSIIRLTEAANLSTFLHEFAHFMYEMEVNGDTEMLQSINSWYKRNAEDVAKEANSYLGEDFDTLKQGDVAPVELTGQGDVDLVETGKPVSFYFIHNTESANALFGKPKKGAPFGREFEPAARFVNVASKQTADEAEGKFIGGKLTFKNPLVMPNDNLQWKETLSKQYGGKVGKKLSKALLADGYDGVITTEERYISETIDLTTFDEAKALFQPTDRPTAKEGDITPDDVITFLDQDTTGNKDKDAAIRRAVHEQFARGFETYLMEGKSPSIELRNAFRAFARWLSRIYQSLRGQLNVNLDAEMRQVFDRLIATEEQIQAAEARARVEPLFTDAAMAGMTEDEFAKYQTNQEKVKDVQSETLRDKIIKQLTRQTKEWWKEEKQDIIDEETDSLGKQQVYSTRARLKDGDVKLDHATVKELAGEEKTNKLGRTSVVIPPELRGMTAKGMQGVHPDEAAAFFGYSSGSEMLMDLVTAPAIKVQAETNAEARMIERHGDILTDGTIEREADEAVRNEERGKLILAELKALAKGTNAPTVDRQTIKALAEERVGKLSFRQIQPGKYRKAEIRAAQEAARMLAEGNKEGAAGAKMRQVTNYYLGMAATNAKNETTKIVDRMARYNKKKVRETIMKVEGGYWDQIVKILSRFEFRKVATLKEVESLNTWMAERINEVGDGLTLTNTVLNESYVTHWKNVPFSDLQGISESIGNIEHVARYANKLTRMQEEIDFNKLVDRWVTSMDEKVKTRFVSKRTDVVEGRNYGRWFMAQMTKIPFMASWLDGGERAGLSHQIMVQPFTDAYNVEIKLWEETGKPVMDLIENRSKSDMKRHNQKVFIPEIDDNLYGHQILAVALNTGNQGNLKKMLLGEGWADPEVDTDISFDNPKLQAVLSRMTKSDWELVQKIWDQMETLYPKLAEVHRRTTGLTPPKVEATPMTVEVAGETIEMKGGYYPVKYDPNRDLRAARNEDKLNAETESMFSNNASIQASVNAGATNERTGYYAPIRLSLDVVPAHFQETIHYITHHDAVREVNRLTRNEQVTQMIKEKLGPEEYAQLRPWLNDIAKDGREAPTKMFWDDMLQKLRFGVTLGTMGFKASTGIIQISGLSNTIAEVGMNNVMQSMRTILGSSTTIKQAWDFAVENSQVLEHRTQTMDREIKNAMKRLEGKRGVLAAAQEASMKHIAYIQAYMVDLPSWHAAYIKGMSDWGDETRAFQYADWVIENVQGSGATKDMARIMRSQAETGRMFTMFMTFFSSLWNMERDLVKGAKTGRYSTTSVAAKAMFLFTIPVLFEMIMRGELGEPEDEDDRLQMMLTKVAMFPTQSIPFIRDIANATTGEFGYNISPLASVIEQGTRTLPQIVERGFTDDEITKGQVKGATKFIGAATGIPGVNQAWSTGEHLYDVLEEGEDFTVHQLLFGPERK